MDNNQYAHTGRRMFIITWILFFGLLFVFFYFHGQSGEGSFESHPGKVIITADEQGHYRIDGTIDDKPVHFIVDTGATLLAIPERVARDLNLSGRYPITMQIAKGTVEGSLTRVSKLSFGNFTLYDVKAVIILGSEEDTLLMGMNVLSHFSLTQTNKKLVIEK
ncbi:aspartyl protease [Legionella birminghamensis]|uniref:Aspartyl protease n=1 Tax=Legionella birminghamensis TaxID=28083 RepID=A0A378IBA0_9GAMM|nr:retropepsin-like aspartic protease [Legionella birminghamensis]KTC71713.1 aspartyl protease [Legionella birminghamensis]STX32449.1 Aspartyl protease [Legionella birminghamensis]